MSLFSLIAVLLLEQLRPLPYRRVVQAPLARFAAWLEGAFNAGERGHGVIAWLVGAGVPVLVVLLVDLALYAVSPLLAWLWDVGVLYLTMGFRQFSHHFSEIELALRRRDLPQARRLLGEWRGRSAAGLDASEVARLAIEQALTASHRHVFGVVACFVVLPGPAGALLYRLAAFLAAAWDKGDARAGELGDFGSFARQVFALIDWVPARLTAASFAIVGNFEDAIYCWRTQAPRWRAEPLAGGVVLASAAGALGVRLGIPVYEAGSGNDRVEIGVGDPADADFMKSAVALVWRALVLWLLLLLLLGLAGLIGG